MSFGSIQAEKMTTESGYSLGAGNATSFKNRFINGAMTIDQRNAGASVTPAANAYTLDRWLANVSAASKFSVVQSTAAPAGFTNSVLLTSTSAYSVASGDYNTFQQRIEANNMMDAGWGTSSAQAFTFSFWVRSSLTGTFGGSLYFPATTVRTFPFSYVINSANTWEQKTITITGDTTSNTAPTGTSLYVLVQWALGVGSTYTTATAGWQNGNFACPTGSTNLIATNGATLQFAGAQFEVGTVATSFDFRSYGTELALCQRYFEKDFPQTVAPIQGSNQQTFGGGLTAYNLSNARAPRIRFAVVKRTAPSITFYRPPSGQGGTVDGLFSYYNIASGWTTSTTTTIIDSATYDNEWGFDLGTANAYTAGQCYLWGGLWTASAEL